MGSEQAPGADFLGLDPADAPQRGRADWLTGRLRDAILDGRLTRGARLPPTRQLAVELGFARGVVVEAYQRLGEASLTAGAARLGTVVTYDGGTPPRPAPEDPGDDPIGLNLLPGVPDLAHFPTARWLRAERLALAEASTEDLRYGDPRGAVVLRRALAAWLARMRGVRVDPDSLLITSGVAQSLALLAVVLGKGGRRRLAVEDPGSRGA